VCRWIAYAGQPVYLEKLVTKPENSLIAQSLRAQEGKTETNGDGFGIGWYGSRETPGLYREVLPAWSDENLRNLASQIQSPLFFAHVRASTGTATSRDNCHPFRHGNWLFMHNGQVSGYEDLRRELENELPDGLFRDRVGTTDSELMFLLALAEGLQETPIASVKRMISRVCRAMRERGVAGALRFTAVLTDGDNLFGFRFATDKLAPSLYYRQDEEGLNLVSEPLDSKDDQWLPVPPGHVFIRDRFGQIEVRSLDIM